jgi:hypothetical protein
MSKWSYIKSIEDRVLRTVISVVNASAPSFRYIQIIGIQMRKDDYILNIGYLGSPPTVGEMQRINHYITNRIRNYIDIHIWASFIQAHLTEPYLEMHEGIILYQRT